MASGKKNNPVLRSNLSLGAVAAESDHLLSTAFYDNGDYAAISSFSDRRCFVIGRTGSGKSALFRRLREREPHRVITIVPENLSLPYLTNLNIVTSLLEIGVHLEPFFRALWKHIFLVEVLRSRYRIDSREAKLNVMQHLRDRLARDEAKKKALDYLDEFGDRFWCETDERIHQITQQFEQRVMSGTGFRFNAAPVSGGMGLTRETAEKQEVSHDQVNRYQNIVNSTQLPRLNEMIRILGDEILESDYHRTYILIDDLDRDWVDSRIATILVRCLFDAVLDMQQVQNLKILVALRTNIFQQLQYGLVQRGGQEEKVRGSSITIQWTSGDLIHMLNQRALAASSHFGLEPKLTVRGILPNKNRKRGDPIEFLLGRTQMRPRDLILYMNACIRVAAGKKSISWDDIHAAEDDYSRERLLALRDEWKDPYPGLERLFDYFRDEPLLISGDRMGEILENAGILALDSAFSGATWMSSMFEWLWRDQDPGGWAQRYGKLARMLYTIGFLGTIAQPGEVPRYRDDETGGFQDLTPLQSPYFIVHPAYHRALSIGSN